MSKIILNDTDSFIRIKVNKENPEKKFIEVEFNDITVEEVANTITSLAGIMGQETGSSAEQVLLDIVTSISTGPMIMKN